MAQHTATEIVDLIRATNADGSPALSKGEATLLISLFASAAIARSERKQSLCMGPMAPTRVLRGGRAS